MGDNLNPKIGEYIAFLKEFNESVNVYSKGAYSRLDFHVADSLVLAELVSRYQGSVVDLGSGSGFPSVIMAIQNPELPVIAVESKTKKARFLEAVGHHLALANYTVINQDANEVLPSILHRTGVMTAKAFMKPDNLPRLIKRVRAELVPVIIPASQAQVDEFTGKIGYQSLKISRDNSVYYYLTRNAKDTH